MGTAKITLKRLQETTVDVEYDEPEYRDWLGEEIDTSVMRIAFVQGGRHWGDDLGQLLSRVRESDWKTVDSGDGDTF